MKHIFTAIIILVPFLPLWAQTEKYFTSNKELSSNLVNQIYQDSKGFIWVATEDGLNRFDGNKIAIYRHENKNPNSLQTNYIETMLEDHLKRFWIGTAYGLSRYNRTSDSFTSIPFYSQHQRITPYIKNIIEAKDHNIWIATSGQGIITISPNNAITIRTLSRLIHTDYINTLYEDHNGYIWIGTENRGLFEFNPRTKSISPVKTINSIIDNNISAINEDRFGDLLVASFSGNLYRLDASTNQFMPVPNIGSFLKIISLERTSDGNLYICTDGQGIKIYNPVKKCIENSALNISYNLYNSKIHSLISDNSHNLWMGLFEKGVILIPQQKSNFEYIGCQSKNNNTIGSSCIMSIFKDEKSQTTWVGTDNDGLYVIDKEGKQEKHFHELHFPNTILCIFKDSHQNFWCGSFFNGLANINPYNGKCQYLPFVKNHTIYCLNEDKQNNLWIGTYRDGIYIYNLNNHKVIHYSAPVNILNYKLNTIPNNWINDILTDHNGNIWIGTCAGLSCYDSKRKSFISLYKTNDLLSGLIIYCLCEDSKYHIWIGTTDGMFEFDTKSKKMKRYTVQNGLPNNVICGIHEGSDKNLWISTHYGLSKYNPEKNSFTNYYNGDGIQGNEFTRGASYKDQSGKLFFGGVNGITAFYPQQIKTPHYALHLMITNFYIANHAVKFGDKSGNKPIINTSVYDAKTFNLAHKDNSFSIELSAMDFVNSERIIYQYKMDYNDEWISLRPGMNQVTFSELKSGKHHFIARAINEAILSTPIDITINIRPEWYFSIKALLCYICFLIGICYFIYRYIDDELQNRRKIQQIRTTEKLNESKLQFFINISHEIRTPMTLVINPVEKLIKSNKYPELKETYNMIYRNSLQILRLINQIMDLRKLDKGLIHLTFKATDLNSYINELMHNFTYQAKSKNIMFNLNCEDNKPMAWIDRNNFDKIILNILGNAFKYTPNGGEITVTISKGHDQRVSTPLQNYFEIDISDTGIGIDPDKIGHIFDRFYQINNPYASSNFGTGIGLNLAMRLVYLHHGTIKAQNRTESSGCRFIVRIPQGNSHLTAEETDTTNEKTVSIKNNENIELTKTIESHTKPHNNAHVLIVDDEDEMRNFIYDELNEYYYVTTSKDGKEALEMLLTRKFDLVISDIMMPVMDGIELCRQIKKNININYIPIILLTAKTAQEDEIEGLEIGADAYIPKPFSSEILLKTVDNLIENRKRIVSNYENKQKIDEKITDIEIESTNEQLMERIMKVINNNLSNHELNVEMLAKEVGISRVHIYRKLKEITNMSAHEFIKTIRLKQAAKLLLNKRTNVSDIAYATGFNNLSHFSNAFKEFFGESPKEYIENHAKS